MSLQRASLAIGIAVLSMSCGGTVTKGDGTGSGGGPSGEAGAIARSGSASLGGGGGTAGNPSLGGAPSCAAVDCAPPRCAKDEVAVLQPGACCSTCRPRAGGCEAVECQPAEACDEGYELAQPPGACCVGCFPKASGVTCDDIPCQASLCRPGYTRGDLLGGCCYDCLPDPLFCRDDTDCVMADKPRACCGCSEAITRRQYELDPCWSDVSSPRPIPSTCYPQVTCDAVCGPCSSGGEYAACFANRCTLSHRGLK